MTFTVPNTPQRPGDEAQASKLREDFTHRPYRTLRILRMVTGIYLIAGFIGGLAVAGVIAVIF